MRARLVSTVIPVRNRPRLIVEAIASVLAQTHRPIEVIVVDDGSTDETPRVLDDLHAKHPDILKVLRRDVSRGPGAARETGRRAARGAYIQYLDSDDLLDVAKLECQVAALQARPDVDVVYGDVAEAWEGEDGVTRRVVRQLPSIEHGFPLLLRERAWHTFVPLYRRELVDRAGPWLPLWNEEDWEYDGRLAALGARYLKLHSVVGTMRRQLSGHLSGGEPNRRSLASCATARSLLLEHALTAGIQVDTADFQSAVRSLFHLARQCGAIGLGDDSRKLMALVRAWSRPRVPSDVTTYIWLGRVVGWRQAGRLAAWRDRRRDRGSS